MGLPVSGKEEPPTGSETPSGVEGAYKHARYSQVFCNIFVSALFPEPTRQPMQSKPQLCPRMLSKPSLGHVGSVSSPCLAFEPSTFHPPDELSAAVSGKTMLADELPRNPVRQLRNLHPSTHTYKKIK